MSLYTVTIEPFDAGDQPAGSAQAVVRVDTGAPKPRIVEMTLQSSAASGLTSATLPAIDLKGVVEALQSGIAPDIAPPKNPEPSKVEAVQADSAVSPKPSVARSRRSTAGVSVKSGINLKDDSSGDRVYRRMPDAKELAAVYDEIGTVTGVAKHYAVPRHTAQGWMARLRKLDTSRKAAGQKNRRS